MSDNKETYLALLPSGFVDLLPGDAEQEARSIASLMNLFFSFGYERIKPPLVEFEDSLLAPGPGAALSQETFRLMDPLSHRMMGIRSDITPQIARIASSRLVNEGRPLRLSYANDVLRIKGSQQRMERQFAQVGCELIGASGADVEIESAMLALMGLSALGLKGVSIDLSMPRLVDKVLCGLGVSEDRYDDIYAALARRDYDAIGALGEDVSAALLGLLEACGSVLKALPVLLGLDLPEEARADVQNLSTMCDGLVSALSDIEMGDVLITIDVLENKGFEYHSGIGFMFFAKNVRGELGRGGRYDVRFGEGGVCETAVGFTLYMDSIRAGLPVFKKQDKVFVGVDEEWTSIVSLQKEGWVVVRGTKLGELPKGVSHVYSNGEVNKIDEG